MKDHSQLPSLLIDATTADDLNLFGSSTSPTSPPEERSLFTYCNKCRTTGGERVLLRRMKAPETSATSIRATQCAVLFIMQNLTAFDELPPAFVTGNVDEYTREGVPIIPDRSLIEFASDAFALWANEDRFYVRITKGVELSGRLIRSLRRFLSLLDSFEDSGELYPMLNEMQTLLAHPGIAALPAEKEQRGFWRTLRLDQLFRLHESSALKRLLELIHELDALASLARVTKTEQLVLPEILSGEVRLSAKNLGHPFLEDGVTNPVKLNQNERVLFLTGPNMAGKTTYLRSVATAVYLAHLGMGVLAKEFSFVPVERLLTSISMRDDLDDGISYFRAEALRVKAVAHAVAQNYRVMAIMDEPFKGTNVKDAFDASLAILQRFSTKQDCLFMVSSHLIELSEQFDPKLAISYQYFEAEEQGTQLRFDYVLHDGVSSQRLGMRVLEEEGIFDLLEQQEDK